MTTSIRRTLWAAATAATTMILLGSCGVTAKFTDPVSVFTQPEKTPREYSGNYNQDGVKAPKSEANKAPWVVFSDRDGNITYVRPAGKVKQDDAKFLEPFFVIGQKGDFLKLIKYDPAIVKNGRLTDRKKAKYVGWMSMDHLLLTTCALTDVHSGVAIKHIPIISDTLPAVQPKLFFVSDSVKLFKDPELSKQAGKAGLYDIVYLLKRSPDSRKVLICATPQVKSDAAAEQILGWVSAQLIHSIGQQLFVDLSQQPAYADRFYPGMTPQLKYSPAWNYMVTDSTQTFSTAFLAPVVDKSDNFVLNADGNKVTYGQSKTIEQDLRHINVVFLFELGAHTIEQLPLLVSAMQMSQPLFAGNDFTYRFAVVVARQGESGLAYDIQLFTGDYAKVVDFVMERSQNASGLKPVATAQAWNGLDKALDLVQGYPGQTNVIVVAGETGGGSENADKSIVRRLVGYNCRLLGLQTFAGEQTSYNNFVLQCADMIEGYGAEMIKSKRSITFYADQLRSENAFKETARNSYTLDYPRRSVTQGAVVFPDKDNALPLDMMTAAIDSLLTYVKADNALLIASIRKAFGTLGNQKDRFDASFVSHFGLGSTTRIGLDFKEAFAKTAPQWYCRADSVSIPLTSGCKGIYHLMLTEGELEALKLFVGQLSAKQPDVKGSTSSSYMASASQKHKTQSIYPLNIDRQQAASATQADTIVRSVQYAATGKIRRHLQRLFISEIRGGRVCPYSKQEINRFTLAQAALLVTSAPTCDSLLQKYTVGELKNRKALTDSDLDQLVQYFKAKVGELNAQIADKNKFKSSGQDYIWIDSRALP